MARTKSETATLPMLPSDDLADNPLQTIDVGSQTLEDSHATETTSTTGERGSDAPTTPQTVPSLLDRLKAKADAERQEAENAFTTLVKRLARDEATEAEVTATLPVTGKSLAELESAVDHERRINRLQAIAADLPAADASMREARIAFNLLKESQKQQQKAMEAEFKRVRGILHIAEHRLSRSTTAEYELSRLCPVVPPPEPPATYFVPERRFNNSMAMS